MMPAEDVTTCARMSNCIAKRLSRTTSYRGFALSGSRFAPAAVCSKHSLLLVRKSDFLASISLLLVSKSDLLVSILLFITSKSDFLVAAELASFSGDPSTLRPRARPVSSRRLT